MQRGVTSVSLLLVCLCLTNSSTAAASITTSQSGRNFGSHGAARRNMLQESDQTSAEVKTTEGLQDSTQQHTPAEATETSSNFLNSATDNTPDVSEPDATEFKGTEAGKVGEGEGEAAKAEEAAGEAAEAAPEPDSDTLSPDADSKEGETSAEESGSSASTSRQLPEVNSASSAQSMQNDEDDMASSNDGQAGAASDTNRPESNDDDSQAAGLTLNEASAESAFGAELSDPTPPSNSSSSSDQSTPDNLTFDQAVAATNGTQSITDVIANSTQSIASELKAVDPRGVSPVLESLLPSTESLNGSLSAAIQEPEGASNATAASNGEDSYSNATVTKVGEELVQTANASVSMLDEDVSAIPVNASAINATRDVITGAASSAAGAITAASGLLSNATSALTATTNTAALNATKATVTAGGSESDSLLGSEVLNATVADGVLHSSVEKVTGVLGGVKSWLNSSRGGLQGVTGKAELAGNSTRNPGGTVNASSATPGSASVLGRPAAHTATQGVTGAIANATDAVLSLSRAAAAELGTEEDTLTAQTPARVNQSARSPLLPGLSDDEGVVELEDEDNEAHPAHASGSHTASAQASNTTHMLQRSGSVQPASTQATGSAGLIGTHSSNHTSTAAGLANPKGSASAAVSLADQRAAEMAQDRAEQRASQQAGGLTQPKGSAFSAHNPKTQAQALADEADAQQNSLQNKHNASTGTAKTARYADGQLIVGGVNPSGNEELNNYGDPRAQAQHETASRGAAAGSHSSGRSALPAGAHSTQTGQLLGVEGDYNPQAALGTNFQSGATGVSQHSKTAPTFDEEYGGGGEDAVVPGRAGAAATSALTADTAASQAARAKPQKFVGTASGQAATAGQGIQSGNWPQAAISSSQGTSASSAGAGLPSGQNSLLPGSSGVSQPQTGSAVIGKTGTSNKYDDDYVDQSLPLGQHTRSDIATASDSARAGSKALPSMKPLASGASDTLTPAQQRELERESAYQASTGSAAAALTGASSTASGKTKATHPSWATIAGQSVDRASQGASSSGGLGKPGPVANLGQSSTSKQQSLGDGETDADMEDYDPRVFATGSSTDSVTRTTGDNPTGQAQGWNPRTSGGNMGARVQPSMGGEEAYDAQQEGEGDSRNFMATRDPTDPNSVVNAQLGRDGQLRPHSTGVNAAGAGAQATKPTGSKQSGSSLYTSGDELAGPIVTGVGSDKTVTQQRPSSKQSTGASSTLHGLLDNVINNWVIITALSALVCTGAVLGFVFLRGFVPSPYDAITISNSGTSTYASSGGGYAANNGYHGVSMKEEEIGWESWAEDDLNAIPQVKKGSNGNSPSRGTGVGKLKKGTFAKKKPANWSNDF